MAVEPQEGVDLRRSLDAPPRIPFSYNKSLDGVRGIAILLIMVCHYGAGLSEWALTRLFGLSLSLDLFFALSGYLITALLLEEWSKSGGISMRNFYVRRALRLLPALYVMLVIVVGIALTTDLVTASDKLIIAEALAAAFYVYPVVLVMKGESAFLIHLWSLSLEEWFYLLWPGFLLAFGLRPGTNRRLRIAIGVLVGLCVVCFLVRLIPDTTGPWRILSMLRPDSIALGALVAFAARKLQNPHSLVVDRVLGVLGPVGVAGFVYFMFAEYSRPAGVGELEFHDIAFGSWNYQLGIWCAGLTVLHLALRPEGRFARAMSLRPLIFIGIISYAVYLWHQPLFLMANGQTMFNADPTRVGHAVLSTGEKWALGLGVGVVSFLVALLSRRFVEQPALRLKRRFETVSISALR